MPAEPPYRDEQPTRAVPRTGGRPTAVRRPSAPAGEGTRAVPVTPEHTEPVRPVRSTPATPQGAGQNATTYGRPALRRPTDRPAGQQQRLAPPRPPGRPSAAVATAHAGDAGGRDAGSAEPPTAPPAPPRTPGRRPSSRRRRRRLAAVVVLVLVCLVVYPLALGWKGWSSVHHVAAASAGARPADTPGTTYLIVGSDSRAGMSAQELSDLSAGGTDGMGQRTDTIMLMHVPAGGGPVALISVPRDSYVPIPGHGRNKINAAFSLGGPQLLTQTLEDVSGLRIDHYVETGFGGFAKIVDAVGGVQMCPAVAVDDVRAGLRIAAGCQRMDGRTALGYARYRYSDPLGDLGRANRQRALLAAIVSKAASPGVLLNPFDAFPLASSGGSAITVDDGSNPLALVTFLKGMRAAAGSDGISMTVPVGNPALPTASGTAVKWDSTKALQMFADLKSDDTAALKSLLPA